MKGRNKGGLSAKRGPRLWNAALASLCMLFVHAADAAQWLHPIGSPLVWIIMPDQERAPYARFLAALRDAAGLPDEAFFLSTPETGRRAAENGSSPRPRLVVAVGTRASADLCARGLDVPTLLALIPKPTYDVSLEPACRRIMKQHSAVYLDQPLARQAAAARLALPHHRRAVTLLGPEARARSGSIATVLRQLDLEPLLTHIDNVGDIFYALERIADQGTVLLALPDPLVFTARTAPHILLAAYRYRMPVIGHTENYVRAGALLAVYSSPEQIGQQVGEIVERAAQSKTPGLPPPQYPKYFSVAINRQVARSLGLNLPTDTALHKELSELEENIHD